MGGAYKSSSQPVQNSYTWSTDWIFTETEIEPEPETEYVKDGQSYTIAGYVARNGGTTNYVYYDGTTRSMSTTIPTDSKGVWKAVKVSNGWKFETAQAEGKYLTYEGVDATGAVYTIEPGVAEGCLSMRINGVWSASSETGDMGGKYKASNNTVQSDQYNWSTDWKITEYDDSPATGGTLIDETKANAQPIYHLSGVRVNRIEKGGIYIHGGNKIVAK